MSHIKCVTVAKAQTDEGEGDAAADAALLQAVAAIFGTFVQLLGMLTGKGGLNPDWQP